MKTEEVESFFNFFKSYEATAEWVSKASEAAKDDDSDLGEKDDNEFVDEEYDLGVFIKDELVPYSLEYFLDIVDDDDCEDDEDEDGEDEDEEEAPKDDKKPKRKLF